MAFKIVEMPQASAPPVAAPKFKIVQMPPPQTVADGKVDRERSWGETAQDMALSGLQGINSGVQSLAGTIGDAQNMTGNVASWGADKLGFSPETSSMVGEVASRLPAMGMKFPTTEQIGSIVNPVTGRYSPETTAGRWTESVGEMVPAAVAGPGGVLRKTAMAVIPGVSMAAVGDMTDQNPYAKVAAGVVSGALTAGRGGAGTRQAVRNAPTAEEIAGETTTAYNTLRRSGVAYDNNSYGQFVADLQRQMAARGYRPRANNPHPIASDLDELAAAANNPLDFSEVESLRKSIGKNLQANASREDRAAANFVREQFDNFIENAPIITNGNIPADQVRALTRQARELASRNIKNSILEEAIYSARQTASGFENGMRIEMRKILKNPARRRGFSEAEISAMEDIAGGTKAQNLLAQFGRLGISIDKMTSKASLIPSLIAGGGYTAGAVLPAVGVVGAATAAKYGSRLMAEKSARDLTALTRVGRQGQNEAAILNNRSGAQARSRGLLGADAAVHNGAPQWFIQDANGRTYPMPSASLLGVPR